MLALEIGKIYTCEKYLLLYPTRSMAISYMASAGSSRGLAAWWATGIDSHIVHCEANRVFVVLEVYMDRAKILIDEMNGWIINADWIIIKEAK